MVPGSGVFRQRGGRAAVVVVAIAAAAIVAALAWNSEALGMMFKLRMWDKEAPARAARTFFEAAAKGDQTAAERVLDNKKLQPLKKKGKWAGYQEPLPITGIQEYRLSRIVPKEFPAHPKVEFMTMGEGAAYVWVPRADGKEERYRLEQRNGGWKLVELAGGQMAGK